LASKTDHRDQGARGVATVAEAAAQRKEPGGSAWIYEQLRQEIIAGAHQPGSRLVEVQLAEVLGVSRTPVRAALARLEGDGLVETIPNRGAFVSKWDSADLEEVYALRLRLEPYAARLAAGRVDGETIERLTWLADEMVRLLEEEPENWIDRCMDLNGELHLKIVAGSDSPRLISMVSGLTELPLVRRAMKLLSPTMLRRNFAQHHQMIQALRESDPEWAEALMSAHILGARHSVLSRWEQGTSPD